MRARILMGAAALLALPGAASAYVIQVTGNGAEIRYRSMPQEFFQSADGCADVTDGTEFDAVASAFGSWADVTESDARFSKLSAVQNLNENDIYNDNGAPGRDRNNVIAWVEEDWAEGPGLIAITYDYFVEATGKLLESDIAMNGVDYEWTTDDTIVQTDVESIAAHEIGHAFGLGHSLDTEATMFATASQGETKKRSLEADDMAAIRHSYPPGCCPKTKVQEGLAFFGCSMSAAQGRSAAGAGALLAGLALTAVLVRRRSRSAALIAALLTLPLSAGVASATTARVLSLAEMSKTAESVVRGRVIWTQAMTLPGGGIVTVTEVEVEDVIAGDAPATVTVVEPGGEPGDTGVGMSALGTAKFELGEEVVLFAERSRAGYKNHFPDSFRPMGMSQGKLRVVREAGAPARVVRDLSGMARVVAAPEGGWAPYAGDELSGLDLDVLVDAIVRSR